eukprot:2675724-Rhodomonas_salina.2
MSSGECPPPATALTCVARARVASGERGRNEGASGKHKSEAAEREANNNELRIAGARPESQGGITRAYRHTDSKAGGQAGEDETQAAKTDERRQIRSRRKDTGEKE